MFQKLTKGKDSWSLAEVVHAIVILTHFHSLCSFVFSCGVNQEVDQLSGYKYRNPDDVHEGVIVDSSDISATNPKDVTITEAKEGEF